MNKNAFEKRCEKTATYRQAVRNLAESIKADLVDRSEIVFRAAAFGSIFDVPFNLVLKDAESLSEVLVAARDT